MKKIRFGNTDIYNEILRFVIPITVNFDKKIKIDIEENRILSLLISIIFRTGFYKILNTYIDKIDKSIKFETYKTEKDGSIEIKTFLSEEYEFIKSFELNYTVVTPYKSISKYLIKMIALFPSPVIEVNNDNTYNLNLIFPYKFTLSEDMDKTKTTSVIVENYRFIKNTPFTITGPSIRSVIGKYINTYRILFKQAISQSLFTDSS